MALKRSWGVGMECSSSGDHMAVVAESKFEFGMAHQIHVSLAILVEVPSIQIMNANSIGTNN